MWRLSSSILAFLSSTTIDLTVHTTHGPLRGTVTHLKDVNAFLGIPYAEPPIGDLRFSKPIPKEPWTEVYNATRLSPPCAQYSKEPAYYMPDVTGMSEDCLYLNLWVPKAASDPKPVVVFIHGGAFVTGTASFGAYDGSKLASRGDVIVANFNYRVGAMGFFVGRTDEAPGNMGMFDQLLAIKWIKDNAQAFGGDPDNVVLMGESAGAYSISMLMVSPMSRDLVKRAILQSGSAIHPYMFDNAVLDKNSRMLSSLLGCANGSVDLQKDPGRVVDCMKRKSQEEIVEAEASVLRSMLISFYPRIGDDFMPRSTVDLCRSGRLRGDVSVLVGTNRNEGALMNILAFPEYFGLDGHDATALTTRSRAAALLRFGTTLVNIKNASSITGFYLERASGRGPAGYLKAMSDFWGDFCITCGTAFFADFVSLKGNPVYFYKFAFRAASTPMAEWVGTTHFDEVQYVFGNPFHQNFTEKEMELSNLLMDRWSAFARTGNPNLPNRLPWLPYSYHKKLYLHFGQEEESIRMNPNSECEMWRGRFKSEIDSPPYSPP